MLTLSLAAQSGVLPLVLGLVAEQYPLQGQPLLQGPFPLLSEGDLACHVPASLSPSHDGLPSGQSIFNGKDALELQIKRHQAIVRVPTVCYDDLVDFDTDSRWDPFYRFHDVLEATFPAVHRRAELTKINTFGLVYTFHGSDPSLKPALLTAHQDVVPVNDPSLWTYPPFEAVYDGEWLWGRGAADDKASLTALFSAFEALAANQEWRPKRTYVLAFGFDEESSGYRGAKAIGEHLLEMYGENGFVLILDEGNFGIQTVDEGTGYALVGTLEKGHLDVTFSLSVRGGHSSQPLPHTAIGIMAEIVASLESRTYAPKLTINNPIFRRLACQLLFSPDSDRELLDFLKRGNLEKLAEAFARKDAISRFAISSSVAVTTIRGGQKINALPELVILGANFRLAPQDSVVDVQHQIVQDIEHVVKKYGLAVTAFKDNEEFGHSLAYEHNFAMPASSSVYNGTLDLTASEVFPVTPEAPTNGTIWDVFAGTIRHSFSSDDRLVVPVGNVLVGNTDTRHYLKLSENIYRWLPLHSDDIRDYHAADERFRISASPKMATFYYDLVLNLDTIG